MSADRPRRPNDPRAAAEAAFKVATTKPPEPIPATSRRCRAPRRCLPAPRPRRARSFPGGWPRLAGPHQRGAAQGGRAVKGRIANGE